MNAKASTDSTARKILKAAKELFAERGYAATTTRAIADAAGVNEVTLFRRFSNKAGILNALGERITARQAGNASNWDRGEESARKTLTRLAKMEVANAVEDGGFAMRLLFDSKSVPEVGEMLRDGIPSNLDNFAGYLREKQAAGELRGDIDSQVLTQAFFALTSSFVLLRQMLGQQAVPADMSDDELVEQLVEVFWSGAGKLQQEGGTP